MRPQSRDAKESLAPATPSLRPSPAQLQIIWSALTLVAIFTLLAGLALIFFGFVQLLSWSYPVLLPIGLSVLLALLLDIPVSFLCRTGYSRTVSSLAVLSIVFILFVLFLTFLLPPLIEQSHKFFVDLPGVISQGTQTLPELVKGHASFSPGLLFEHGHHFVNAQFSSGQSPLENLIKENKPWVDQNLNVLTQRLGDFLYGALAPVGQAFGFLLGFGFVPIYVFYFLADRDRLIATWRECIPLREEWHRDEVLSVIDEICAALVSYFRGQIMVASCNGFFTTIGLAIIGLPNSLFLGVMAGAFSIVPFLGIIVSIIPCLFIALATSHSSPWLKPLLVLGVFAIVQMLESLFVSPRIQSHSTGLHPLTIIFGILFWSLILPGILGPLMAVPLTCMIVVLLKRYVWRNPAGHKTPIRSR